MMKEQQKPFSFQNILMHIAIIFLLVLIASAWLYYGEWEGAADKSLFYFTLQGCTGIILFMLPLVYFNIYWLIPNFLVTKKYIIYGLLAVGFIVFWGAFIGIAEPWTDENWFGDQPQEMDLIGGILAATLLTVISGFLNIAYRWFVQSTKIKQLENERLLMELSVLKNQINPHFFFNTLNNLYALSLEHSDQTPQVILKLSEMMRYAIYECKEPHVTIENEIRYIENYLALEKIRQDDDCSVSFDYQVNEAGIRIAPMLLIVFIENAFKHGFGSLSNGAYIDITLKSDSEKVYFSVVNNYQKISETDHQGLGIENVKRRLSLLYPDSHELKIENTSGRFLVNLTLKYD